IILRRRMMRGVPPARAQRCQGYISRQHGREGKMIQVNGLNHIVLHVQDVARAKKFYTELLGMTVYRENDAQAFLHCGHQGVALFKKQGDTPLTLMGTACSLWCTRRENTSQGGNGLWVSTLSALAT